MSLTPKQGMQNALDFANERYRASYSLSEFLVILEKTPLFFTERPGPQRNSIRARAILKSYCKGDNSLAALGRFFSLSVERIRQILKQETRFVVHENLRAERRKEIEYLKK